MLTPLKIWIGLALVLFGLVLPYPFHSIGLEKGILFPLIEPFLLFLLDSIWEFEPKIISGYSDGKILYLLFVLCFISSAFLLLLNQFWVKISTFRIYTFCCHFLIFLSVLFLFKYGFDKILGNQFPLPEGNLLETRLKNLNKDILFWTAMSGSKIYIQFMGWIEIIPAFLILFERTRKIGLIVAFGVLTNVFFVNLGFDITVKLISFYLVAVVLYILTFYWKSLKPFFFSGSELVITKMPKLIRSAKYRYTFTCLIVFLFLYESILPHLNHTKKDPIYTSYTFTENALFTFLEIENVQNIHIHSDQFLILEKYSQNNQNRFESFPIQRKKIDHVYSFYVPELNQSFSINTSENLQLIAKQDTFEITKINYAESPFFEDNFTLFLEDYFLRK